MKKIGIIAGLVFFVSLLTTPLPAQDGAKFSIPLPLTGSNAKFGEIERTPTKLP
jgi:hypothetical protein